MTANDKIDELSNRTAELEKRIASRDSSREAMDTKYKDLSAKLKECCGESALREKIIAHNDIKQLIDAMKSTTESLAGYEARLRTQEKYLFISFGVLMAAEFFGGGDAIRKIIGGG